MGNVVRITANVVTALQWQRSSRAIGYSAAEAKTIAEAEKLLDEMEKK